MRARRGFITVVAAFLLHRRRIEARNNMSACLGRSSEASVMEPAAVDVHSMWRTYPSRNVRARRPWNARHGREEVLVYKPLLPYSEAFIGAGRS